MVTGISSHVHVCVQAGTLLHLGYKPGGEGGLSSGVRCRTDIWCDTCRKLLGTPLSLSGRREMLLTRMRVCQSASCIPQVQMLGSMVYGISASAGADSRRAATARRTMWARRGA